MNEYQLPKMTRVLWIPAWFEAPKGGSGLLHYAREKGAKEWEMHARDATINS